MDGDGDPDPALAMDGDGDPYYARHGDRASYLRAQANHGMVQDREEEARRLAHERLLRRGRRHKPRSPPSSSRESGPAGLAETGTRVRQSVLYSDRPRRSRGRRERAQSPNKLPDEEQACEVSSSELGSTVTDPTKLQAPTLSDSPPKLSSLDGPEWMRQLKLYAAAHTFDDLRVGFAAIVNAQKSKQKSSVLSPHGLDAQKIQPPRQISNQKIQPPRQISKVPKVSESFSSPSEDLARCGGSTKEIIENGKRWMSEEVMLTFEKYIEGRDEFKDVVYCLDELQHQCFSVETYQKIFHHYNFTVKMKEPTSADWSLKLYFAQVKEMYGVKFYFCCPLEPHDDGYCHACRNQGMDALKHPADHIGFEAGQTDTECPFIYMSDDSDDDGPHPVHDGCFDRVFCKAK